MDENNREGGLMDANVNYVGMWTANKATGLAFQIDTAVSTVTMVISNLSIYFLLLIMISRVQIQFLVRKQTELTVMKMVTW